eukprot:11492173-Alexandrium_andersonii.AAC.1
MSLSCLSCSSCLGCLGCLVGRGCFGYRAFLGHLSRVGCLGCLGYADCRCDSGARRARHFAIA